MLINQASESPYPCRRSRAVNLVGPTNHHNRQAASDSSHNSWIFTCDFLPLRHKTLLETCSSSPFWTNHHTAITTTAANREFMSHKQLWSWLEKPVKGSHFAASHFFHLNLTLHFAFRGSRCFKYAGCAFSAHSLCLGTDGSSTRSIHFLVSPPLTYPAQIAPHAVDFPSDNNIST
jgi:hypothetical protein